MCCCFFNSLGVVLLLLLLLLVLVLMLTILWLLSPRETFLSTQRQPEAQCTYRFIISFVTLERGNVMLPQTWRQRKHTHRTITDRSGGFN